MGSETALRDAVTNAVGPTVIVFTADIQLTGTPLNIVAGKDIVLTSNSSGVFFRLIGVSGQVTITVAFGGVLELAGITVTHASGASGRGVNIDVGGSLILTDGTISRNTAPGTLSASGGGVYNDGGNFTMFGGVVSNNTAAGTISGYGGGIYIIDGNFTMFGGVVSNNTATSGGGIYNSDSNFTMSGGTIANNTARGTSNGYGGGIYSRGGPFTMFNGTIANNTAGWGGGGIYSIYSSVTVFNGTMSNNNAGTSGGGVCTAGGNFTMTGGTIANNNPTRQGGGIYNENGNVTMYSGAITNNTALVGGGIYNSYGNVTMSGGAITNNTASEYVGGGIYNEGGNVTMLDGTIANNTAVDGGGVHSRNGDFTMSGGAIANNTATNGGGVTNYGNYNSAQFTMCGGVIANNTASVGGGIYNGGISTIFNVYYVNLTMCGGVIANNTASEGGGIYNDGYGNITMSGGAITNNTAEYGGGIYSGGNVTMFGGTIANNTANQGGGIYSGGNVTMFGGTIANNTADYGGGIHNIYGNVTMSNGTIVNNTAKIYGGGIYNNIGSFTMSGGTIVNSTAFVGGGINNSDGSFTMSGGTIVNSTAFVGGGIYNADSNFTMSGGTIVNSTAYIGGGIYNSDGNVTMSNGTIANNTATNGGGIYLASGLVTLFGGMVVDNSAIVDGGGVWVAHQDLNKLFVYDGVIFSNNSASIAYNRDPADDATYYAQIGSNVVWTTPFTQGYNNYDISYTNGTPYILYTVTVNDSYAPITGAGDYQAGENVTINAGIRPGYTFINWTVNEGNITLPSTPTATFTMPEGNVVVTANWQADQTLTGMISVTKLTNPPNSETIFNFVTSAPQEAFNLIDGAVWDSGNLTIGTYTITELAQAGWNLTDIIVEGTPNYTIDLSSGTATLTLEAGQHLNLTYLNNNQETSSITVNKVTTGVSSGGSEVFYFVVSSGEFFNLTADASWNSGSLPPGTYTVTEWQGPWNVTDIQVTGTPNYSVDLDNRTVTFTLELGQHINITFTDNLLGVPKPVLMSFRADKVTVPLGAEAIFDFVPSFGAPFSLGDGDYLVRMITNLGLYSVTELMQPGWVLSDIIVEGTPNYLVDLDAGTVLFNPLYSGNPVFVTFVNEELAGSVTVLKQTLPLGALTQFNFTTTAPGGSFTLADGETWSSGNLSSGTYVISELAVAGWDLVDIVVQGASNYTVDLAVGSLVLYLGAGESVFVTFINGEQERPLFGSISVIKAAYPSDTQTVFTFVTSVSGGIFTLVDGAVWDSGSLAPGDYVVTELGVAGWDLTNIIVLDPTNNSYVDLASRSVF
ncbi:MAG: hypothetical protein FWD10_06355, partial [Candidatus Bathyarchaeota archaeon]|nr:hypothetical protein [Candidatus Termitimicrobium sp.]